MPEKDEAVLDAGELRASRVDHSWRHLDVPVWSRHWLRRVEATRHTVPAQENESKCGCLGKEGVSAPVLPSELVVLRLQFSAAYSIVCRHAVSPHCSQGRDDPRWYDKRRNATFLYVSVRRSSSATVL